jgi:hypothetical protein
MTIHHAEPPAPSARGAIGRLGTAAAWISAACCLPYLFLKVVWTLGMPIGINDRSMLDDGGWVAANALMAAVQLIALTVVLVLVRPAGRRLPAWLLLFPVWVGTGLLFDVAVGSALVGLESTQSNGSGMNTGGIEPWVYVLVYASFAGQGVALAIAFACHVRARWGALLGRRTGDVVGGIRAGARSWPEKHLAQLAQVTAMLALVTAAVAAYWAAGGSVGLSAQQEPPSSAMQLARVAGVITAASGLLALAGRWGTRTRFWVPAGLTWLGSGAMAAFDTFTLGLNGLFAAFGDMGSGYDWSGADAVVVVKITLGLLAAAIGVVALVTAARYDHELQPVTREVNRFSGWQCDATPEGAPRAQRGRLDQAVPAPGSVSDRGGRSSRTCPAPSKRARPAQTS